MNRTFFCFCSSDFITLLIKEKRNFYSALFYFPDQIVNLPKRSSNPLTGPTQRTSEEQCLV